jgi:hypothetical protein
LFLLVNDANTLLGVLHLEDMFHRGNVLEVVEEVIDKCLRMIAIVIVEEVAIAMDIEAEAATVTHIEEEVETVMHIEAEEVMEIDKCLLVIVVVHEEVIQEMADLECLARRLVIQKQLHRVEHLLRVNSYHRILEIRSR